MSELYVRMDSCKILLHAALTRCCCSKDIFSYCILYADFTMLGMKMNILFMLSVKYSRNLWDTVRRVAFVFAVMLKSLLLLLPLLLIFV